LSITSVDTDYENLTITLIAEFDATIEQVWDLWSDPRKLERWWGPPTHPATFEKHDLTPGGETTYYMTGPEGAMWGVWRVRAVDPPTSLEFINAYADPDGTPAADMPLFTVTVRLTAHADGDAREVRIPRGDGEDGEHGHRRRPATGRRPNRRTARVAPPYSAPDPAGTLGCETSDFAHRWLGIRPTDETSAHQDSTNCKRRLVDVGDLPQLEIDRIEALTPEPAAV
jgi:uncharacterized protein YndB with AHSA1/START domain